MVQFRQLFVRAGFHTPRRRLGAFDFWKATLPESATLKDIHRSSIVLPRLGDGHYAPPPTQACDGFPWGELTSRGTEQMRALGRSLHVALDPSNIMIRAPNQPHTVQSAQAIARGLGDHFQYAPVYEILIQNGEHLECSASFSSSSCQQNTNSIFSNSLQSEESLRATVSKAMKEGNGIDGFDDKVYDWEELCSLLESVAVHEQGLLHGCIDVGVLDAIGRYSFARVAEPLHANPTLASETIGPLMRFMCDSIDEAEISQDTQLQLCVVPAETMVALVAAVGLAPQLELADSNGSSTPSRLGTWPAPGSVLEFTTELDKKDGHVMATFEGQSLIVVGEPELNWEGIRRRIGPLDDVDLLF